MDTSDSSDSTLPSRTESASLLSPAQLKTLEGVRRGLDARSAAFAARIHGHELNRWVARDEVFRRALRQIQADRLRSARREVRTLAEESAATIAAAIRMGDVVAAVFVARGMGVLGRLPEFSPAPTPAADPPSAINHPPTQETSHE